MKRKLQVKRTTSFRSPRSTSTVPPCLLRRPRRPRHAVTETDLPIDPILSRRLAQILENQPPVGDGFGIVPGLGGVSQGVHVGVRANAGIAEEVPGTADVVARFEDGVRPTGTARLQVIARADARNPGTGDEHVKVFARHRAEQFPSNSSYTNAMGRPPSGDRRSGEALGPRISRKRR